MLVVAILRSLDPLRKCQVTLICAQRFWIGVWLFTWYEDEFPKTNSTFREFRAIFKLSPLFNIRHEILEDHSFEPFRPLKSLVAPTDLSLGLTSVEDYGEPFGNILLLEREHVTHD